MIATHNISDISFGNNTMSLVIDSKTINLPLDKVSKKLLDATELQRSLFQISPSGYGIHWPLIDEDLSIDAILKISDKK